MSKFTVYKASFFKNLFDIYDGTANQDNSASLKELQMSRDELDNITLQRLREIVLYANNYSEYYKKLFAISGFLPNMLERVEDIKKIPILTRDDLKQQLEIISTKGDRQNWVKSASGGTTSAPVSYYRCKNASLRRAADTSVIDSFFGKCIGDKIAYLWGASQDLADKKTIGMWLRNITYQKKLMLPSAPLNKHILKKYYDILKRWQPSFIQSYPAPLYELCMYLKEVNKRLHCLHGASVTAEPLYDYQRELIEEILGFKIYNWYGSRELGRVAFECEYHDGLHINEPSMYLEIEPDPSLPDGYGYLVVTDLWNTATPFVRYMTGDIAKKIEGTCKCGRALSRITTIEGRVADLIVLSDDRKIPGVTLSGRVIKDFSEITEYQIIQKTYNTFQIRYVKGPEFNNESLTNFEVSFKGLVDANVNLLFDECMSIERSPSGKMRTVISEVNGI